MNNKSYEVFGKYIFLEKLAAGGMAEVFLARSPGAGGIGKFVAIKRILPQFSESQEFIDMFKAEAKIAINLSHSNIVSIYEFGVERNQFFLVMDYVEGRNLRQILNKMKKSNAQFSIDQIVYVCKEVAAGLDHAHRCLDGSTGKPLNITHRDMSPQNVMISYEGEVKIVDFGIAKAENHLENTRAGTLKGKFGYMSPEQAEGQTVDLRTDIFSLGIVLWELLANDRLFIANNEINTLRKVRDCQVPSLRKVNPNIHVELEHVVQKSLARDRNLRYQTAAAMHRDLSRYLNRQFPDFSPHDYSMFVKTLFTDEILEIRQRLIEYAKVSFDSLDLPPTNSENPNYRRATGPEPQTSQKKGPHLQHLPDPEKAEPGEELASASTEILTTTELSFPSSDKDSYSLSKEKSLDNNAIDEIMRLHQNQEQDSIDSSSTPNNSDQHQHPHQHQDQSAELNPYQREERGQFNQSSYNTSISRYTKKSDLKSFSAGKKVSGLLVMGCVVALLLYSFAAKFYTNQMAPVINLMDPAFRSLHQALGVGEDLQKIQIASKESTKGRMTPPKTTLTSRPTKSLMGPPAETPSLTSKPGGIKSPKSLARSEVPLLISSTPSGAEIYVNGRNTGKVTPSKVQVPASKEFRLILKRSGYIDYERRSLLKTKVGRKISATLQKALVGYINIDVLPPRAVKVFVNGQKLSGETLPIFNYAVPAKTWVVIKAVDPISSLSAESRVFLSRDQKKSITLYLKEKDRRRK